MPHKDPIIRRQYMAQWKKRNSVRHKMLNKFADAAIHANQRAVKYGAIGILFADDIRRCLAVGKCFYCNATEGLGIDHRIPIHIQGPNTAQNIVACCLSCNASKHRSDRPGRWSRKGDACIECGTASHEHICRELCIKCYRRKYYALRRGRILAI